MMKKLKNSMSGDTILMSNLIQQDLEERWYEEGLEIAEIKGYSESSWDLHAESYVRMMRRIYENNERNY